MDCDRFVERLSPPDGTFFCFDLVSLRVFVFLELEIELISFPRKENNGI